MSFMQVGWKYEAIDNEFNSLLDFKLSYKSRKQRYPFPKLNGTLIRPDMNENLISNFITSISPMCIGITCMSIMHLL
jgi:hypothetical protein